MDRETLSMLKELITDANKQRVITDQLGNGQWIKMVMWLVFNVNQSVII